MTTCNARFCYNNWLEAPTFTSTSSLAGYPSSNLYGTIRNRVWKPEGTFEISATNNQVYIDSTPYTIPVGTYNVTSLITAFNTATSKTLSRNSFGRFVITSGGSVTLNLSNNTNAIWDVLGYLTSTDLTGTTFTADERRYSTGEWFKVDLGVPQECDFAGLVAASNEVFSAPLGVIRLQGNNLDTWISPPVDIIMETSGEGAFIAPSDKQACRFWRVLITDRTNNAISVAKAYIGDAVILQNTNIATGFTRTRSDQSVQLFSEAGQLYIDRRPKVLSLTSLGAQFLRASDLSEIEQLFYDLGIEKPFFLCIDPTKAVSTSLSQMTHYVYVTAPVSFQHVIRDYYNVSFEIREVL